MRFKSLIAAGIAAGLALTACGGDTTDDPTTDPGTDDTTAAAPAGDDTADPAGDDTAAPGGTEGGAGGDVGVFTWWAEGSEKVGLDALESRFTEMFPNNTFVNLAVAGGAGSNAKAKLEADLQNNNPPDSFQGHAGAELFDYIQAEQIVPVNDVMDELGGADVFPQDLLDLITVDGSIYSIPSNVHRSNVVWVNPAVLDEAGVSHEAPADLDAWIADMQALSDAGVETPLSIGTAPWTQVHFLESILLAELGADDYNALFIDGDWNDERVRSAVDKYAQLLEFANTGGADDWPQATDMVIDGSAAYNLMGDWAVAQFNEKGMADGEDYLYWPTPGTDGVFLFLADSFTLPNGAPNPEGGKDWLRLVGSAEGQLDFNLAKGSIPARTDVSVDDFPAYQQSAMESFNNDTIASSIAHGAATSNAWLGEIQAAVSSYWTDKDADAFHAALVTAADNFR